MPGGPIEAVFEGVNERGLAANLLNLAENDVGLATANTRWQRLLFAARTQCPLSPYGSVAELVKAVEEDRIPIVPVPFALVARRGQRSTCQGRMPAAIRRSWKIGRASP